jgi:ABC-type protease/lipase transport system fused ATPase/permease subunit
MFAFSLFSNVLRLTTPLFMIQVIDRVLSSRNIDTLINLFIIAVVALTTSALIVAATKVMQNRVGSWVERALLEPILRAGLEGKLADRSMGAQTIRDLGQVRNFFAQQTLSSLFDLPWTFVFLTIIVILSPIVGGVALAFASVLIGMAALNVIVTRRAQMRGQEDQGMFMQQIIKAFQNSDIMHSISHHHDSGGRRLPGDPRPEHERRDDGRFEPVQPRDAADRLGLPDLARLQLLPRSDHASSPPVERE